MSVLAAGTRHRSALWTLLAGKLLGTWGLTWDIQWHLLIGRDTFWIPPHLMMYGGIGVALLVAVAVLARDTVAARRGTRPRGAVTILGLTSFRGVHLAAWGVALVILAAPIDDLWHRLFGLDVTLWSPPHLLGLFGSAVNTLGALLLAVEAYPAASRARLAALLLGGALLYGGVRVVLEPAWLTAYTRGGVAFHAFAILGALLLPLALLPPTRLLDRRWAPVAVVLLAVGISVAGERITRVGFALAQPEPAIAEAIRNDPASPIAVAAAIRATGRGGLPLVARLALPVLAVAVMAGLDPRRRPIVACVAYGVALLGLYGWLTSRHPAFAPLVPSAAETAVALALVGLGSVAGGLGARWLADALGPRAAVAPDAALTSPAR